MPPPTCKYCGHSFSASSAAFSFPGPSMITWAPVRWRSLYNVAKCLAGSVDTWFVLRLEGFSLNVPPTICFTWPECKSMQGLNRVMAPRCFWLMIVDWYLINDSWLVILDWWKPVCGLTLSQDWGGLAAGPGRNRAKAKKLRENFCQILTQNVRNNTDARQEKAQRADSPYRVW